MCFLFQKDKVAMIKYYLLLIIVCAGTIVKRNEIVYHKCNTKEVKIYAGEKSQNQCGT